MTVRVVAIDGPPLRQEQHRRGGARRLGFLHVDSGALYRGLTRVALDLGPPFDPEPILASAEARGLAFRIVDGALSTWLDDQAAEPRIRAEDVTAAVSEVSAIPRSATG